jgi:hypothetical protein
MEIPPDSSIAQSTSLFSGRSKESILSGIATQYPVSQNNSLIDSSNRLVATSATNQLTDFKFDEFREAYRMMNGPAKYPFQSIAQISNYKFDPYYFDGSENQPNFNVQENLIGTPLGTSLLEDPRLSYVKNLLTLKEYQGQVDQLNDSYIKELYMVNSEKGSNYYINMLEKQDEALGNWSRLGREAKDLQIDPITFSYNLPTGETQRPQNPSKKRVAQTMYSATPSVQRNIRQEIFNSTPRDIRDEVNSRSMNNDQNTIVSDELSMSFQSARAGDSISLGRNIIPPPRKPIEAWHTGGMDSNRAGDQPIVFGGRQPGREESSESSIELGDYSYHSYQSNSEKTPSEKPPSVQKSTNSRTGGSSNSSVKSFFEKPPSVQKSTNSRTGGSSNSSFVSIFEKPPSVKKSTISRKGGSSNSSISTDVSDLGYVSNLFIPINDTLFTEVQRNVLSAEVDNKPAKKPKLSERLMKIREDRQKRKNDESKATGQEPVQTVIGEDFYTAANIYDRMEKNRAQMLANQPPVPEARQRAKEWSKGLSNIYSERFESARARILANQPPISEARQKALDWSSDRQNVLQYGIATQNFLKKYNSADFSAGDNQTTTSSTSRETTVMPTRDSTQNVDPITGIFTSDADSIPDVPDLVSGSRYDPRVTSVMPSRTARTYLSNFDPVEDNNSTTSVASRPFPTGERRKVTATEAFGKDKTMWKRIEMELFARDKKSVQTLKNRKKVKELAELKRTSQRTLGTTRSGAVFREPKFMTRAGRK